MKLYENGAYLIHGKDVVINGPEAVAEVAAQGGTILFVGTKKQAQDAVKVEAERCGMFYVNERWLGEAERRNQSCVHRTVKRVKLIAQRHRLFIQSRCSHRAHRSPKTAATSHYNRAYMSFGDATRLMLLPFSFRQVRLRSATRP